MSESIFLKHFSLKSEIIMISSTSQREVAMQQHTIITISRQHGSGGWEIGRKVAEQLNIPFYDRDVIRRAAQDSDIDISFFENSEIKDTNSVLYELSSGVRQSLSMMNKVFLQQFKTIRDLAKEGSCVIVGRCADAILADNPHILRVFVYADIDTRKKRVETFYNEPVGDLEKLEKKRALYYQHYTGKRFGDAQNYDMSLNSGSLGLDECVKMICSAYHDQVK